MNLSHRNLPAHGLWISLLAVLFLILVAGAKMTHAQPEPQGTDLHPSSPT